jgi:parallel beta-helix repeat protein
VRLDGFKGALLSVLVMASIMASILVFFISITLVSATTSSTINKTLVKANTSVILTVTVTNSGTSPIDNVRIIVENGSGFAPLKTIPEDNIVRCYSDNVVVLPAGTVVQLLANENIILPEGTNAIVENGKHLWVENYLAFTILLENAVVAVRQDTVAENIPPGDNIGVTRGISVNLNNDNRLRLLEDTSVVLVGGNTVKLPENTLLQLDAQNDNSQIFGGENVTVAQNVPVTIKDNHVILVTNNPANTNFVNLPPGEYLQLYDNQVILASGTTVQLGKTATVRIAENESVVREMGKQLDVTGASVVNLPLNWMQTMGINDPLSYVPAVEWDGIGDNSIPVGGSLAFPFALTTPSTTEDRTPVRIWVRTPGSIEGPITLMVDGKAPTVSVTATPTLVKENTAVTITVVASEVLAKLENVLVAENNAPENSQVLMISTDNITWTGTYTTGDNSKRDGLATIYVIGSQFEDLVGNKGGGVTENTFTIDRCKPPAPNLSLISGLPPMVTNIGTWMIEGTALDNFLNTIVNLANGTVRVRVGTTTSDVTSSATGYFFKLITMTQGTQEIGIRFIDRAGNIGDENAENITFDNMPPVITPNTISGKPFVDGVVINDNTPTVNLSITDATLGIENVPFGSTGDNHGYRVRLRDENGVSISILVNATPPAENMPNTINFENTFPTELSNGTYQIYVVAGDNLQMDNLVVSFVVRALTPHSPIYIDGNDNFTLANGVTSGSGMENDPYIIENWDINAENANGIDVENTTAYFVIRNCYVHDGNDYLHYGIYFDNVRNGGIGNNLVENNWLAGIILEYSNNNVIANNTCKINFDKGISLEHSSNNAISNNICENNYNYNIWVVLGSDNNTIDNNTCSGGSSFCIAIQLSSNNILLNNSSENNNIGIFLNNSDNTVLDNNICSGNEGAGITIRDSNNNTLTKNTLSRNKGIGIYLWDSNNNSLINNTCLNNGDGIYLIISGNDILDNNTLENNQFSFGVYGLDKAHFEHNIDNSNLVNGKPILYLRDRNGLEINQDNEFGYLGLISCENVVVENVLLENNIQGVLFAYTKNSRIENARVTNNNNGIDLCSSYNNTLTNNTCDNNNECGIALDNSKTNFLLKNAVDNNSWGIYIQKYSDNNLVLNNTIGNNVYCGINLVDNVNNNLIYHNNFVNNIAQAYDECSNYWDNGYPSGGNYWSDYTGTDANGDGIGDTPYNISGGGNQDKYPLMNPLPTANARLATSGTAPYLWGTRKAIITVNLLVDQGDNLRLEFLKYDNTTVEAESVIWSRTILGTERVGFTNLIVPHPGNVYVKRIKLVLTDNAGTVVLDNMAWYTVVQDDWSNRIIWIILNWGSHNSSQQDQLSNEISTIILNWGSVPTSRDQHDFSQL